jgi:hypothetical protein
VKPSTYDPNGLVADSAFDASTVAVICGGNAKTVLAI